MEITLKYKPTTKDELEELVYDFNVKNMSGMFCGATNFNHI